MKKHSKNIFFDLFFTLFIFLFALLDSVLILTQLYVDVNAQAAKISPIPAVIIISTPTPFSASTPTPSKSLMKTAEETSITPSGVEQLSQISNSIDLKNWKLTLPVGESDEPKEIFQPELSKFSLEPWFNVSSNGLRFRAGVNGVTTSGSSYPRSELREMTNSGLEKASWSSTSGLHTMFLDQAITAVPQVKKQVVAGQIHDGDDDVMVIRLEYPILYINVDGDNEQILDSEYILGKRFSVMFEVSGGQTKVFYNSSAEPVYTLDKEFSGAYFKAGAYTQSNCSKEESAPCDDNNFGEVTIYQLEVSHQ